MRMVGGGKRAESTCLQKNRRILEEEYVVVSELASSYVERCNPLCMPSSSEDLTFAKIISVGKGRKTVNLKTTMILDQKRRTQEDTGYSTALGSPVYQRKPSPYLTLPSPTSATSNTQIQRPTSWRTRFAYFLLSSLTRACSAGRPN
jgi:hypothetical protein